MANVTSNLKRRTHADPPTRAKSSHSPEVPHIAYSELQIGARLKHARILSGVLMRELAAKVDCTASMISKIESGRVMPSLPMLHRLVDALGRDLSSFFGSDPNSPGIIQRNGERPIVATDPIRSGSKVTYERLIPFGAGNLLEGNIHIIEPDGAKQDPITHQGETLGLILEGKIELTIESTTYQLNVGDSFFFKNHLTNSYRNVGPQRAKIIWVNTPQVH
jgi:transcriptional regulator with XRE-family HTH domain